MANTPPQTILVVDDSPTNRMKLTLAVRNLGYTVEDVDGGQAALDRLAQGDIDLVLLDIVMPEVDGYDVLRAMRADDEMREIPTLVISSLEDLGDVVQAIELGAQDFLTKSFDPVFLSARVATCLERKRLRDHELEYIREVRRLTSAAQVIEDEAFDPSDLGIASIADRDDRLGQLARVFSHMASEVHRREAAYRNRITLLHGSFLLLAIGMIWGLTPSLARLASSASEDSIGMTAWIALLSSVIMIAITLGRRRIPKITVHRVLFGVVLGAIGTIGSQVAMFAAAEHVSATILAILLALESLLVFALAAILGIESPNLRRFAGLIIGLFCVLVIILSQGRIEGGAPIFWIGIALLVPVAYAVETIMIAAWPGEDDDPLDLITVVTLAGTVVVWPVAFAAGEIIPAREVFSGSGLIIPVFAVLSCLTDVLIVITLRQTGAVFTSQTAYVTAGAGVVWGVLLLGEMVDLWTWLAIAAIGISLFLVQPNRQSDGPMPARAE